MAEQTSSLRVRIDTNDVETRIQRLNQALGGLSRAGNSTVGATNSMSSSMYNLSQYTMDANGRLHDARGRYIALNSVINQTNNSLLGFNSTTQRSNGLLGELKGLLGGIAGIGAFVAIAKTADSMQNMVSQIKQVTSSEQEYLAVRQQLELMANKTQKDIESTAGLYTNSARALSQLGKSQQDVLKFTNAVSLAMSVGGKSAQEQSSALLQLGQAMQSGVVQGDEFRSIAENAPILLDLVAESLHKTRGEIKSMASEGKITSEVMYNALANSTDRLEKEFAKMPITMSGALTVVKNEYKKFVDTFMNGTGGISQSIAGFLVTISKNFDTLAKVALVGAGLAFVQFAATANVGAKAMTAFNLVMKANPIVLVATAVLGVASAFYGLDDVIDTTAIVFKDLFDVATEGLSALGDLASAVAYNISTDFAKSNSESSRGFGVFFDNTAKGFTGLLQGIGRVVAAATATLAGFMKWMGNGFWQALRGVANAFIWMYNTAGKVGDYVINGVIDAVNKGIAAVNTLVTGANSILAKTPLDIQFNAIGTVQYRSQSPQLGYNQLTGKTLQENIGDYLPATMGAVDNYFQQVETRVAQAQSKAQQPLVAALNNNTGAVNKNTGKDSKDSKDGKGSKTSKQADDLQMQIFNAWMKAGLSAQQSRIMTAEVGRENDYKRGTVFGYHEDRNNHQVNVGFLSWQKDRGENLKSYLKQLGLLQNGVIQQSQESLDAMAKFAVNEMLTLDRFKRTREQFLKDKDVDPQKGFEVMGRNFIAWDYDGRKIDANKHKTRRDNYYSQISAKTLDTKENIDQLNQQQKAIEDTAKKMEDLRDKQLAYLGDQLNGYDKIVNDARTEIQKITALGFDDKMTEGLINNATAKANNLISRWRYEQTEQEIQLNEAKYSELEKIDFAYAKKRNEILTDDMFIGKSNQEILTARLQAVDEARSKEVSDTIKSVGGSFYDMQDQMNGGGELRELQKQQDERLAIIQRAWDNRIIMESEYHDALRNVQTSFRDAEQSLLIGNYESVFTVVGGLTKAFIGEQSKAYRLLFAVEKAFAFSRVLLANKVQLAEAWASAPFPANLPIVAKALVTTGVLADAVNMITPKGFQSGGYTGNGGLSEIAGAVHGQEFVLNAAATKRIGVDNLNAMNRGASVGNNNISVNVVVNTDGSSSVQSDAQIGRHMGDAIKAAVLQTIIREKRQGGLLSR